MNYREGQGGRFDGSPRLDIQADKFFNPFGEYSAERIITHPDGFKVPHFLSPAYHLEGLEFDLQFYLSRFDKDAVRQYLAEASFSNLFGGPRKPTEDIRHTAVLSPLGIQEFDFHIDPSLTPPIFGESEFLGITLIDPKYKLPTATEIPESDFLQFGYKLEIVSGDALLQHALGRVWEVRHHMPIFDVTNAISGRQYDGELLLPENARDFIRKLAFRFVRN